MPVQYFESDRIFKLDTLKTSYIIAIVDNENFIGHAYYGRKVPDHDLAYLLRTGEPPFVPSQNNRDRTSFLDTFPSEYSGSGLGDYRESSVCVKTESGFSAAQLHYVSHRVYKGKPALAGLPATFGGKGECTTLELICRDDAVNLEAELLYTVFEDVDAVTRSVRFKNTGKEPIYLTKAYSVCMDMDNEDFSVLTLHGSWARERVIECNRLGHVRQGVRSARGETSHQEQPFLALAAGGADDEHGDVYGFHLFYSGNFSAGAELDQFDSVRVTAGINPENFSWKLESGETFQTPEAVCVYSSEGIGQMTRCFHDLYRKHLIRGEYAGKARPVLINSWETVYFDFTEEKLLEIARKASKLGIEMLVLDDGWFGRRNDDNSSLGDWYVNMEKLPGGLGGFASKLNGIGMKLGIWFEPEMVSPDSQLYRRHPDWAISIPGRAPSLCRNQYVLDITRKEVRDYVYGCVSGILRSANIEYLKWDMNRQLSDLGSAALPPDRQGELSHRYVLALYELQERLVTEFPHVLFENCSGGGARFDPGMLYYSPQIWCSDNMDPVDRLVIQEGTELVYPLSVMGAHVASSPNNITGRKTPIETRGYAALAGTFGYELDVTKLSDADLSVIPKQISMYRRYGGLIRGGDYYRIASYRRNRSFDCIEVVSKDKKEALVIFIQVIGRPNVHSRKIFLKGLSPSIKYTEESTGFCRHGATLMDAGFLVPVMRGDFKGHLFHFAAADS